MVVVDLSQPRIDAWNSDELPIYEPGLDEVSTVDLSEQGGAGPGVGSRSRCTTSARVLAGAMDCHTHRSPTDQMACSQRRKDLQIPTGCCEASGAQT